MSGNRLAEYSWGLGYKAEDIERIIAERKTAQEHAERAKTLAGNGVVPMQQTTFRNLKLTPA